MVGSLVGWLVGWLVVLLVGWLVGCLVAWLVVGCLVGWLVGWLVGRSVGSLVGRSVGGSVGSLSLEGHTMTQAVSRRPLTAETRVLSQLSACEICDGQSVAMTGFPPSTAVFPSQRQYINAPYSSFIYVLLIPEGQMGKAWEPSFGSRQHWIEEYFH